MILGPERLIGGPLVGLIQFNNGLRGEVGSGLLVDGESLAAVDLQPLVADMEDIVVILRPENLLRVAIVTRHPVGGLIEVGSEDRLWGPDLVREDSGRADVKFAVSFGDIEVEPEPGLAGEAGQVRVGLADVVVGGQLVVTAEVVCDNVGDGRSGLSGGCSDLGIGQGLGGRAGRHGRRGRRVHGSGRVGRRRDAGRGQQQGKSQEQECGLRKQGLHSDLFSFHMRDGKVLLLFVPPLHE